MAKIKRICRECGKEYEACGTPNPSKIARWFDIACSKECYMKYVRKVEEARAKDKTNI